MKTQSIILVLILFIGAQTASGQQTENWSRIFMSASFGPSFGREKYDIERGMRDSGLDGTSDNWIFGKTTYPKSKSYPVLELELGYHLKGMHGISVDYGINSHFEVSGYQSTGLGNDVRLNSRTRFTAFNYYLSPDSSIHFFAGPVLLFRRVKNDAWNNSTEPTQQTIPGFNIGLSGKILNKKWWFVAMKLVYRWAPDQKTGPFSSSHQTGILFDNPETHTSTFRETNTRMSTLNLLLSAGINFNKFD